MEKPKSTNVDRMPPHSDEAEKAVLACILLAPDECLSTLLERGFGRLEFFDLRHQDVFNAILDMHEARVPIELLSVHQWLKDRGELEGIGGSAFLAGLSECVSTPANLAHYADIVINKKLLRNIIHGCANLTREAFEVTNEGVPRLVDQVESTMMNLTNNAAAKPCIQPMKVLVQKSISEMERLHALQGRISGMATGLHDFDRMTNGLQDGEMIVIAGRPSCGKTSLAMNIAEHVALDLKQPVGVFSMEMTAESLVTRMMASRARVNLRDVQDGFMNEKIMTSLAAVGPPIANAPLYIDDTPALSILQLRAKARRMAVQYGIKLFVIDYLQLMHSTNSRAERRHEEIGDISGGCKALAKELRVPVIVLSQMNRELEKREGKPRMSDLRESGSIEQDADVIGLLYKMNDKMQDDEATCNTGAAQIGLIIAKQRNGPTGEIPLLFLRQFTRFESLAKDAKP